jgi:TolA-binding protein
MRSWAFALLLLASCSSNSAKNQYIFAEKLWNDGKYAAAVAEFEKVARRDPESELGLQALYRAATTQAYFLSQYSDAIRKLRIYSDKMGDGPSSWEAEKQVGDLLFEKMEQYDQALHHYQDLIRRKPENAEVPEFMYRVGKSYFYLWKFDDAIRTYRSLLKSHSTSPWAEKAAYEIGVTLFTRGESVAASPKRAGAETYQEAIDTFQRFIKLYPNSSLIPDAKFGIASCLEEMDQLDAAYHAFEALRSSYPSSQVIEVKLARIKERRAQRSH